jgi:hypothetical protein
VLGALMAAWIPSLSAADTPPVVGHSVPLTDPSIFLSPYCWRMLQDGSAVSPASGGYLKFDVVGTSSLALRVNAAINAGLSAVQMPAVKVVVSSPTLDGLSQYYQFPPNGSADTSLTVATGLDPTVHYRVLIQLTGPDESVGSGWSGTIFQAQINRVVVDAGATLSPSALRAKRALFLGASYEQAYFGWINRQAPLYTYVDQSLSWPFFVAYAFDCEYGQVGIGSQGWVRHGNGGYPPFTASWDHFDAANLKGFHHDLDYVFIHMAENDAAQKDDLVEKAVAAWIPKARAAFGDRTKIFIILALEQMKSGPIKAGVREAADPQTFVLDPGTEFKHVAFSGRPPKPTWAAPGDGIHLDAVHQTILAAFVIRQAQACIDGSGGPGR